MPSQSRPIIPVPAGPSPQSADGVGPGAGTGAAESDQPVVMTEVELLPAWYPSLVRRRRWLLAQVWATGALLVVLTTVLLLRREDVAATRYELATIGDMRREADATLAELTEQQARLADLTARARLVSQVGLPLEISRVLADVARAAPTDLALSDFEVRTEESAVKPAASVAAGGPPRRTMRFTVKGLAKDLSQAVDFQAQLRENELFRNVRLAGTFEGKAFNQRPVTAFEITFQVDLAAGDDEFAEAGGGAR